MRGLACCTVAVMFLGCGGEQVLGELSGSASCGTYTKSIAVTVDGRPYVEDLVDFPILVTLDPTNFDYAAAGPEGEGIRFVLESCEVLRHEVDHWDSSGVSQAWVRVPRLAGGELLELTLLFGQNEPVDTSSANEVFGDSFAGVYHLEDEQFRDSSTARRTGAGSGTAATPGVVGHARSFETSSSIAIPDTAFPVGSEPRTACMWASSDNDGRAYYWMFAYGQGDNSLGGFAMNRHGTQFECLGGDGSRTVLRGVFPEGDREYRYMCCSFDGSERVLWADGVALLRAPATFTTTSSTGRIGNAVMPDNGGNGPWRGAIDEVRVSRVARSADWIAAEYQSMAGSLVSLGPIESR